MSSCMLCSLLFSGWDRLHRVDCKFLPQTTGVGQSREGVSHQEHINSDGEPMARVPKMAFSVFSVSTLQSSLLERQENLSRAAPFSLSTLPDNIFSHHLLFSPTVQWEHFLPLLGGIKWGQGMPGTWGGMGMALIWGMGPSTPPLKGSMPYQGICPFS